MGFLARSSSSSVTPLVARSLAIWAITSAIFFVFAGSTVVPATTYPYSGYKSPALLPAPGL